MTRTSSRSFLQRVLSALLFACALIFSLALSLFPIRAHATVIFLTSGTSWTVPANWTSSNNTIEVIGGGGGGNDGAVDVGGGGGGYSRIANATLTPNTSVTYKIGAGGAGDTGSGSTAGGDSYFCNRPTNCASIAGTAVIVGGKGGQQNNTGAQNPGGQASAGVGTIKYNGGSAGFGINGFAVSGSGGGGAAGPLGAGADSGFILDNAPQGGSGGGGSGGGSASSGSSATTGTAGGNNNSGSGGGSAGTTITAGGAGSNGGGGGGGGTNGTTHRAGGGGGAGTEWDATHGSGGGGGGAAGGNTGTSAAGGAGGLYGGGGGSGGGGGASGVGGDGAQGIIVITYGRSTLSKPPNNLGLVGYWSFDEGTGTKATDFSGNRNAGTLSGSTLPSWTNGKRGKALSFDGSTSYVTASDSGIPTGAASFSACTFFKISSGSGWRTILQWGTRGVAGQWNALVINPSDQFDSSLYGNDMSSGTTDTDGAWHHGCVTYDGVTRRLYLDGTERANVGNVINLVSNGIFRVGNNHDPGEYFPGSIDDVRIYSRALSAGEVAKLYGSGAVKLNASSATLQNGSSLASGLVGLWTFDGPDVTTVVTDRSGQSNNGYFNGGATSSAKTIGKLGQALTFNGSTSYVSAPYASSLKFGTGDFAVSSWFKTTASASVESAIVGANRFGISESWILEVAGTAGPGNNACFSTFGTGSFATHYLCSSATVNDGRWHQMTGVRSGTNIYIYLDGAQANSGTVSGTYNSDSGGSTVGIATLADLGHDFFNGAIDDVRIYNRALSATEVLQLYKLGTAIIKPN